MSTAKIPICEVCGDHLTPETVRQDDALGEVCGCCHYRLRVSGAWLKHHNMKTSQIQPFGSMGCEERPLV